MRALRTTAFIAHAALLAVGALFAIGAVGSVIENFASDFPELAASRIVTAVALVSVTAAYGITLAWRGFTPIAPLSFAASYLLLGGIVGAHTRAMAKHFAPAPPEQLGALYTGSIALMAVVVGAAAFCWLWTLRRSRFPLF